MKASLYLRVDRLKLDGTDKYLNFRVRPKERVDGREWYAVSWDVRNDRWVRNVGYKQLKDTYPALTKWLESEKDLYVSKFEALLTTRRIHERL